MSTERETLQLVQRALFHLRQGLGPFVEAKMIERHGDGWMERSSRARSMSNIVRLDEYGLLKTLLDNWRDLFGEHFPEGERHKVRAFASLALEARNAASHATAPLTDEEALRYLDAIYELLRAVNLPASELQEVKSLYNIQRQSGSSGNPQNDVTVEEGNKYAISPSLAPERLRIVRIRGASGKNSRVRVRPSPPLPS